MTGTPEAEVTSTENEVPQTPKQGMRAAAAPRPPAPSGVQTEELPSQGGPGATVEFAEDPTFDLVSGIDWSAMPEKEQVDEWKKQFGGVIITRYAYGFMFFNRVLGRREYKQLMFQPGMTFEEREDAICQMTLLWPAKTLSGEDFNFTKHCQGRWGGFPSTHVEYILDRSGFVNAIEVGNA